MGRIRKSLSTLVGGGLLAAALVAPAGAATQIIDATLSGAVAMTTSPTATVNNWALAIGANSKSAGNMTIQASVPYVVTVTAEKATLTEWNPAANGGAGGYVTGGKTLTTPMVITPSATGGTVPLVGSGVSVLTPSVGTGSSNLVTGIGGTTDTYSLSLGQTVLVSDSPTTGSNTYHNVLTYTASAAL